MNETPGLNGSDKEKLCGYTPFALHVYFLLPGESS